jgi:uncharacterized cupredoxin-like copper-binding protein
MIRWADCRCFALLLVPLLAVSGCQRNDTTAELGPSESVRPAADAEIVEVEIRMGEFWFEASQTEFVAGQPYRFVLRNVGEIEHEWAVVPRGDTDESRLLTEVEEEDLPPGAVVTHVFAFPEPGEYDFACFLAGHYEGGMVIPVTVRAP